MSEEKKNNNTPEKKEYSLNDDRRVKTLSPGALTAKRFFRNRLAVIGLVILATMFLFSFVGGWVSPYAEDQVFYKDEIQMKEFVGAKVNDEFRYLVADGQEFGAILKGQFTLAQGKKDAFTYKDVEYKIVEEGEELYSISTGDTLLAVAYKDIVNMTDNSTPSFSFAFEALKAKTNEETSFTVDGTTYQMDDGTALLNGEEVAFVSRLVIQSRVAGTTISREFRAAVEEQIIGKEKEGTITFEHTETDGTVNEYRAEYDPANLMWSVKVGTATRVYDDYASPNGEHPLGTDKNGMDMLTRLMYGGRISLIIGFIVVGISAVLGVIMGGISGYFGGWVDNLIMRIVDIFYCIPSTPMLIILGAAMDGMRVDPTVRMFYLMLILGFLGWPGIARLVRGQILSLREQEFMTATESSGLSVSRRIFKHLIPNVIPQLIVSCTMSLGSTIITEATLSFLGLGVKFPFASWGNIINDVNNSYVLTHYWFIWIPAGVCLMLAVLGFNFVGDGLRDAFDPKMKR